MKNETISRVILVLEIAAIILFHSMKSSPTAGNEIAHDIKESTHHQPIQLISTSK